MGQMCDILGIFEQNMQNYHWISSKLMKNLNSYLEMNPVRWKWCVVMCSMTSVVVVLKKPWVIIIFRYLRMAACALKGNRKTYFTTFVTKIHLSHRIVSSTSIVVKVLTILSILKQFKDKPKKKNNEVDFMTFNVLNCMALTWIWTIPVYCGNKKENIHIHRIITFFFHLILTWESWFTIFLMAVILPFPICTLIFLFLFASLHPNVCLLFFFWLKCVK